MHYEVYELTAKGKAILKLFDNEFLNAWKSGHNEQESTKIALERLNEQQEE